MLRRMARGVHDLDAHLSHLQLLAILQRAVVVAEVGLRRAQELDVGPLGHLGEAGQVVVVAVGVQGVADAEPLYAGLGEVAVDVALWIEQQCLARLLGADEVGGMPQTLQVELLEEHLHRTPS